jgi:hypothetical protein
MKKIIVGLAIFLFSAMLYEVKAGPPEDARRLMIPYPSQNIYDELMGFREERGYNQ